MKSKIDIYEFLSKMEDAEGSNKCPHQTYEEGVVAGLQWVLEELEDEDVYEFDEKEETEEDENKEE